MIPQDVDKLSDSAILALIRTNTASIVEARAVYTERRRLAALEEKDASLLTNDVIALQDILAKRPA